VVAAVITHRALLAEPNLKRRVVALGRHGNLQFLATAVQAPRGDARSFLLAGESTRRAKKEPRFPGLKKVFLHVVIF